LRDLARLILASDPLAPRLGAEQRRQRLVAALQRVTQRLAGCRSGSTAASRSPVELLRAQTRALEARIISPRAGAPEDVIEGGVDLVFRAEQAADRQCQPTALAIDRALVLIGRRHRLDES
jgi:hypothetical protein